MIEKFEVKNRFTGAIQFTAEIAVTPDMTPSIKLGLAVKWGVKNSANLADAYLAGAYLADAYLVGANLARANLADANLAGANLARANLAGAKWTDGVPLTRNPIQLFGLTWPVTILDSHMQIGCQIHRLGEWEAFDDRAIADMDGRNALKFWKAHKDTLLGMARADGRSFDLELAEAAE